MLFTGKDIHVLRENIKARILRFNQQIVIAETDYGGFKTAGVTACNRNRTCALAALVYNRFRELDLGIPRTARISACIANSCFPDSRNFNFSPFRRERYGLHIAFRFSLHNQERQIRATERRSQLPWSNENHVAIVYHGGRHVFSVQHRDAVLGQALQNPFAVRKIQNRMIPRNHQVVELQNVIRFAPDGKRFRWVWIDEAEWEHRVCPLL